MKYSVEEGGIGIFETVGAAVSKIRIPPFRHRIPMKLVDEIQC